MARLYPGISSEYLQRGSGFYVHFNDVVATFPFSGGVTQRVLDLAGSPKRFATVADGIYTVAHKQQMAEATVNSNASRPMSVQGSRICLGGSIVNPPSGEEHPGIISIKVSSSDALVKPGPGVTVAPVPLGSLEGQEIVPYRGIQVLDREGYRQMGTVATHFAELFAVELTRLETAPPLPEPML